MASPPHITDPNWLFSTAAQSAAAIVAIIGGFIASRVIDLNARKGAVDAEINALEDRLDAQRRTLARAEEALLLYDQTRFHAEVLRRLIPIEGDLPPDQLDAILTADPSGRTSEELRPHYEIALGQVKSAFEQVRTVMNTPYPASVKDLADRGLVITPGPHEWIYAHVLDHLRQQVPLGINPASALDGVPKDPVEWDQAQLRTLLSARTQCSNKIYELGAEQHIQRRERKRISTPEALPSALVVLGYFAIVGIIWPLVVIAVDPRTVSGSVRLVTVVLFISGLGAVMWYIAARVNELRMPLSETHVLSELGDDTDAG